MEKRALIAIALSFLIFFGYTKIVSIFYPEYGKPSVAENTVSPKSEKPTHHSNVKTASSPQTSTTAIQGAKIDDKILSAQTPMYSLEVSQKHASLKRVSFNEYFDHDKNEAIAFMDSQGGRAAVGDLEIWVDDKLKDIKFETKIGARSVTSVSDIDGLRIEKNYGFSPSGYDNDLSIKIVNTSDEKVTIQYKISAGSHVLKRNTIDMQYIEANWINAEKVKHIKNPKAGKSKISDQTYLATSIKSRHFSSILMQASSVPYASEVVGIDKESFASYMVSPEITLSAGESFNESFLLYLGPNKAELLEPLGLGSVINFGKFDPICKLLLGGMQIAQKGVKNYGVAIILLTLLTNILLMPLTKASFMSMRRMQLVQPQMMKIREKFKDNPQRMNKETMELYKKNKVNPMGGCLPMVLQMPIFISLYVGLSKSTELLGARFLWVKDLASPDNIPLPFSLPLVGDTIHLLPIIMVAAMVLQQKISQAGMPQADPKMAQQQKMMMTFMPILFGFIFYPMPSGLVLYWLTNTVTMSLYQRYLKSQDITPATTRI